MKKPFTVTVCAALALLVATLAPTAAGAAPPQKVDLIVVLDAGTDSNASANAAARATGGNVGHIYRHALRGFSISVPSRTADRIANLPNVAYVEVDTEVQLAAQDVPTGIDRTGATTNTNIGIDGSDDFRVDVDVAVIDTGIDREHPDLNVVDGVNCAKWTGCSGDGDDDHYHGTHVGGTIGAIDNDVGVVGVAPGARLHAVKVLNRQGSGYTSWIIAGIDWVTSRAGTIEVANMSLGGAGYSQAEYDAIQGAVDAGVAFAVAAGNASAPASGYSPAAFDNVLTVSALADFNGSPGGGAAPTCRSDVDDTLADFSNFGSAVDIAAPGVCILSTYPLERGSYNTISGTSMASPHAAGGLALLASTANPNSAGDVSSLYSRLIRDGNLNWTDDSGDGIKERLMDVSGYTPALIEGASGDPGDPGDPGGGGEYTTSSTNDGKTWTATITYSGAVNETVSGEWSTGAGGSCTVAASGSCDFTLSGIRKKSSSVTWTGSDGTTVTVNKP